jgi:hypothetical protein
MKGRVASVLAGLALVSAAPVWALAFTTGGYAGTTGQGKRISFTASRDAVSQLRFKENGTCSNGKTSTGRQGPINAAIHNGRFIHSGVSPSGATRSYVQGRLSGHTASGTLSVKARFNRAGRPDPAGTIVCRTGTVHWSATHP